MKKSTHCIIFGILLFIIIFLRVFQLDKIPLGMHIDEAGLGLNAWSIANFGTDRYGNFMPVCPSNFYGEQSAFYTYFCALLVKLFGLNLYTLRLPAVIMGVLAVVFGALLIREKWGTKGFYAGLVLLGVFPCFIMNSRFALDCNAMLGSLTIALYCLVRLVKKAEREPERKLYGLFALTGILFGIVLYTYIIAALVVAVFFILFGLYYLFYQKEHRLLRFLQLFFLAAPLCAMAVPLILVVCVNYFSLEPIVTPFFSVPRMITNRTGEVAFSLSSLPGKLRGLLHTLTSDGMFGSSEKYFTLYPWSIPFVLAGSVHTIYRTVQSIRRRIITADLCVLLLTFAEVVMFLLCGQYNYHINGIFVALAYFCVSGILMILRLIKDEFFRVSVFGIILYFYWNSFLAFSADYFCADTTTAFQVFGGADAALALLPEAYKTRDIYILDEVGEFYFLSNPIPPAEFTAACNELGYITDYGNLHFYQPDSYEEDAVFVCNRASGTFHVLSDTSVNGRKYTAAKTEHYAVFYREDP